MTPSSSFVKFPVEMAAPVAQGAWLRRSAENVFGVAAGDVEPSVRRGRGGWEESGSGTAAMRRGRRGTPLGHTRTCETPRMHGASPACRTAAANRAPSFPPFYRRPPLCMRSAIAAHVSLSANAIPVTSPLERPSGTISAFSSSSSSVSTLFINSCFLAVSRSLPERLPRLRGGIHANLIVQILLIFRS